MPHFPRVANFRGCFALFPARLGAVALVLPMRGTSGKFADKKTGAEIFGTAEDSAPGCKARTAFALLVMAKVADEIF
jgi:hypothetical protein